MTELDPAGLEAAAKALTIYVCDRCGRKEFSQLAIRPGHGWKGKKCGGTVYPVKYVPATASLPPDAENPEPCIACGASDRYAAGFAAGRAAATPDPPRIVPRSELRRVAAQSGECPICFNATPAASPDERLREALALVYVMLTGAEPMWAEMPLDERCARAANEAQQAVLADREAPDPSVSPDQEETRDG